MDLRRLASALALAGCAASRPDVPALVEIETTVPRVASRSHHGIHLVTVARDGSVHRRLHHWRDEPTRRSEPETLAPEQLRALRELLATPVVAEQGGVPFEATEFRITAHGEPAWSVDCYEIEVHHCPVPFVKLWQSLDEILGDLPER